MKSDTNRYLGRLFRPGEQICLTDTIYGTSTISLEAAQALDVAPNFVCLNPLNGTRKDANVSEHRNFLLEFDKGTIEEQTQLLVDFKVPYTTLVYSGGKSLHAVIALDEPVTKEEYEDIAKLLNIVLWTTDPTQKNPSRLTRVAGAIRSGQVQSLVDLRRRVRKDTLILWLSKFSGHIQRTLQRRENDEAQRRAVRSDSGANGGLAAVNANTLRFLHGDLGNTRSRHARLLACCFELFECGVDYDQAFDLISKAADIHGITADPKRWREAEQIVNYVYGGR